MGLLPVLVYYASVARGGRVVAEYKNRSSNRDLAPVVVECLEQVPPLHSRFTLTIKRRIFSCLMEGPFTYCCIVDEALGKSDAFGFLEAVRDEFMLFLNSRGLNRDGDGLESVQLAAAVHREFGSTLKVLTLPLIGVPQKEIDSLRSQAASPSGVNGGGGGGGFMQHVDDEVSPKMTQPLNSGSERSDEPSGELTRSVSRASRPKKQQQQQKQQEMMNRSLLDDANGRIDIVVESSAGTSAAAAGGGGGGESNNMNVNNNGNMNGVGNVREVGDLYPHRKSFSVREAENRWWRNVKIVLVVDVVFCVLLFVIWLGICKGFQCVS